MKRLFFSSCILAFAAACGGDSTGPVGVAPVLDSISPNRGTVGTMVRMNGSAFASDSVRVYFGSMQSPRVDRQNGLLFATAPEGLVLGTSYDVRVVNRGGGADTLAGAFQAVAPVVTRINGVTKPTGLIGMTVLIEGDAFGDALHGKVFFAGPGGTPIQAVIADSANDWTNNYIVTTVPSGVPNESGITVQTALGTTLSVSFSLITGATFSPSVINWTRTTDLPQPLQGLGAVFVPAANSGVSTSNYVFAVGGAVDQTNVATSGVYRARAENSGALSAWTPVTPLPSARAYHATAVASAFTAVLDTVTTGGWLYALGGVDSTGATVSTTYYARVALDGSLDSWQTTTPLPGPLHSARAVMFRGFLYVLGGSNGQGAPTASGYRAAVNIDGTLGTWQPLASLPNGSAFHALLNFGPYFYAVGGDATAVPTMQSTTSGGEVSSTFLARVNLRTGDFLSGWSAVQSMAKARSKHNTVVGGAYLFTTSGVYSGAAGSSENTYAQINADGTIGSWNGATGTNTIGTLLGYDLYNEAAVSFVDASGKGHVLVLGGAKRQQSGRASAAVVYY